MEKILLKGGLLINEGKTFASDILINNGIIEKIDKNISTNGAKEINLEGKWVIPGVIDDQVHFREPGLTHKEDIFHGSRAAVAGGVTSFMDMPNVNPPTTTLKRLIEKQDIASQKSFTNYSFYMGTTLDNIEEIRKVNPYTTCGVKIFMGSSTGNMLVDKASALEKFFSESPILIAVHCEDNNIILENLAKYKEIYGDDIPVEAHPLIRSREACIKSSSLAQSIAKKYGNRLHILHISTEEEIDIIDNGERSERQITGEVCVHHLWFNDEDYKEKGRFIKWNPAIKKESDRKALINAINNGYIDVIATDHAPHTMEEKTGKYTKSASGGPLIQHSLPLMLELYRKGETTMENIIDKMCHAPADIFRIKNRGYLREGYSADIAVFEHNPQIVNKNNIAYKCGWSPLENLELTYRVCHTFVNGNLVYSNGIWGNNGKGELIYFER